MIEFAVPEPIGVGTPGCESLSSYVQRLAAINGTYPGQIVHRALGWIDVSKPGNVGQWCERSGRLNGGRSNNSFGTARAWLDLLILTARRFDLSALTTIAWDRAFPTRGFQHSTLHWCPLCLAEDRIPYHRLVWMLRPVVRCERHNVVLVTRCGNCGRLPAVLHERSLVVRCPWCGSDLREAVPATSDNDDFSEWCDHELGKIVAHSETERTPMKWKPPGTIVRIARTAGMPSAAALAARFGTSKLTTWYWLNGRAKPSLSMAMRLCFVTERSFAGEVYAGLSTSGAPREIHQMTAHLRPARRPQCVDWNEVHRHLSGVMQVPVSEAPSLWELSKRLGIDRRTLRAHHARLCRAISKRHRLRKRRTYSQKLSTLRREIRSAARKLFGAGIEPTKTHIETTLVRPGLFNGRAARLCFDAVMRTERRARPLS